MEERTETRLEERKAAVRRCFAQVLMRPEEEIGDLLVLDIKDADYFRAGGAPNQHGGGNLFARDPEIMGWLFSQR